MTGLRKFIQAQQLYRDAMREEDGLQGWLLWAEILCAVLIGSACAAVLFFGYDGVNL